MDPGSRLRRAPGRHGWIVDVGVDPALDGAMTGVTVLRRVAGAAAGRAGRHRVGRPVEGGAGAPQALAVREQGPHVALLERCLRDLAEALVDGGDVDRRRAGGERLVNRDGAGGLGL